MIPITPPLKLMMTASVKNCIRIVALLAPMAFDTPISRVRSATETNIIFIKPIAAPNNVIRPMTLAAMVTYFKLSIKVVAISSFLFTEKLFSCLASSRLALRINPSASSVAMSMALISLTHTLMTYDFCDTLKRCLALFNGINTILSVRSTKLEPLLSITPKTR